ncbi:MAG: 4-hydroxybenzoate octaprenyltransferase, partial [Pseudomonadota bacterium]
MKSTQWLNEIRFASVSRLERWNLYRELMRWDKPVGFWLLAWPTLTALLIASQGQPSINNLIIFVVGIIAMRSAGCVLNDMADYKFDRKVKRTENRPLAIGALPLSEAAVLCAGLLFIAFVAVLFTNVTTIGLSFVAVVLASVYPFMKRFTYFPQVVLGAAFSWGIVMAFTAENMAVGPVAVLLFLGTWLWTISYDTMYALMDREDDVKIGVKS